jgi:hypothetical protein
MPTIEKFQIENKKIRYGFEGGIAPPIVSVSLPRYLMVGTPFSLDYSIRWIDDFGNHLYPEYAEIKLKDFPITVGLTNEFSFNNTNFFPLGAWSERNSNHTYAMFWKKIPYDGSKTIKGSVEMNLTEPLEHDTDIFTIVMGNEGFHFQSKTVGTMIELVPESELGEDVYAIYFHNSNRYGVTGGVSYDGDGKTQNWYIGPSKLGNIVPITPNGFPINIQTSMDEKK